jgi:dTDP-4-dehydrorhamnose reductase
MSRVLVFGETGQVARALAEAPWTEGTRLTFLDRKAADLSTPGELGAIVQGHAPDAVIIAAAYTDVDGAEREEALATTVNGDAPAAIARTAAALAIPVVHISTDYVFDGKKSGYYFEDDPVAPLNAYGRSKLAGEAAVRAANPRHLIFRTSWVYSAGGRNFLRTMLRLAKERDDVRIVADQIGCPTFAGDIAHAIARALPAAARKGAWGTYHLAGASETTWHGFAEAIFNELAARGERRPKNTPITTADFPTPALRPKNSRLSSERLAKELGVRIPGYEATLSAVVGAALSS